MAVSLTPLSSSLMLVVLVVLSLPSQGTANVQDLLQGLDVNDISFNDVFSLLSTSVNANKDIDRVLALLSKVVPNRVKVPDIGTDLNLHNCYLDGLASSFERAGDVGLDIIDRKASLTFGLAVNNISINCSWKRKVLVLTLIGTAKASTNKIGASAAISVNLQPGAHPVVDEFRVLHLEEIDITFTGLGFLNRLVNAIGKVIIDTSRARLIDELEGDVAEKLEKALRRLKVPKI